MCNLGDSGYKSSVVWTLATIEIILIFYCWILVQPWENIWWKPWSRRDQMLNPDIVAFFEYSDHVILGKHIMVVILWKELEQQTLQQWPMQIQGSPLHSVQYGWCLQWMSGEWCIIQTQRIALRCLCNKGCWQRYLKSHQWISVRARLNLYFSLRCSNKWTCPLIAESVDLTNHSTCWNITTLCNINLMDPFSQTWVI